MSQMAYLHQDRSVNFRFLIERILLTLNSGQEERGGLAGQDGRRASS